MTLHGLEDTYELANGVKIPVIGFGTWQTPDGDVAQEAVETALNAGYRHIDTAAAYGNEAAWAGPSSAAVSSGATCS